MSLGNRSINVMATFLTSRSGGWVGKAQIFRPTQHLVAVFPPKFGFSLLQRVRNFTLCISYAGDPIKGIQSNACIKTMHTQTCEAIRLEAYNGTHPRGRQREKSECFSTISRVKPFISSFGFWSFWVLSFNWKVVWSFKKEESEELLKEACVASSVTWAHALAAMRWLSLHEEFKICL